MQQQPLWEAAPESIALSFTQTQNDLRPPEVSQKDISTHLLSLSEAQRLVSAQASDNSPLGTLVYRTTTGLCNIF